MLLSLERQKRVDPFYEEKAEDSRKDRETGPEEIPMDSVEDAGCPVIMFLEVGTLCQL